MRAVLYGLPQQFALRYREGEWAVYEVIQASRIEQPVV
jgi:hypothetical protein